MSLLLEPSFTWSSFITLVTTILPRSIVGFQKVAIFESDLFPATISLAQVERLSNGRQLVKANRERW